MTDPEPRSSATDGAGSRERADLTERAGVALTRLVNALRHGTETVARDAGVSLLQSGILAYLADAGPREPGLRAIAQNTGVTAPTASEAVTALARKNLVTRERGVRDARVVRVRLTPAGRALAARLRDPPPFVARALASLTVAEREACFVTACKLLRALQDEGLVPANRMCVTCRHFRPHAGPDDTHVHVCTLTGRAFGAPGVQVQCKAHEPAPPGAQADAWRRYRNGPEERDAA